MVASDKFTISWAVSHFLIALLLSSENTLGFPTLVPLFITAVAILLNIVALGRCGTKLDQTDKPRRRLEATAQKE
jgi:hypothetical protein